MVSTASTAASSERADVVPSAEKMRRVGQMMLSAKHADIYTGLHDMASRKAAPDDANSIDIDSQQIRQRIFDLLPWSKVADMWQLELARRLSASEIDATISFYESDAGHAVIACFEAAEQRSDIDHCEQGLARPYAQAVAKFQTSPSSKNFARKMVEMQGVVMDAGVRQVLMDEPEIASDVARMCRRAPNDLLCQALPTAADQYQVR